MEVVVAVAAVEQVVAGVGDDAVRPSEPGDGVGQRRADERIGSKGSIDDCHEAFLLRSRGLGLRVQAWAENGTVTIGFPSQSQFGPVTRN
jgi:hypothetical protein